MKISIKDYMETRNISRRTIYNRIEKGLLTAVKEGNKTYITSENIVSNTVSSGNIEIKKIIKNTDDLHNKLNEFDYNFLKERLIAIEKGIISSSSLLQIANNANSSNITDITNDINYMKNAIDNIEKSISSINEKIDSLTQMNTNISDNIINILIKLDALDLLKTIESIDNKLDSLTEKKNRGIFR